VTPPRSPGNTSAARTPLLALALLVPAAIVLTVAALTPTSQLFPNQGDIGLYLDNARAIVDGRTPYSQVPLEYPPLAIVPMVAPYLAALPFGGVTLDAYKWAFAGWEALLVVVLGYVLGRIARLGGLETRWRDPGSLVAARLPILVGGAALAIAWRFDLFAAVLLAIAVWAALANRPIAAGVALGLGVLAKLYPLAAGPALALVWFAARDDDRLIRFGGATAATIVLGLVPFIVIAGPEALTFLSYQALRGLQIESVGGGLALLGGLVQGSPLQTDAPFKAIEVVSPAARAILAVLPLLTIAGFSGLAWLGLRRLGAELAAGASIAPASIVQLSAAGVLVLLVTSKIFSIQYVVWLVPFAALLPGRKFWLAAAIVALTIPIHPLLYDRLIAQDALPVLVLNTRNLLVVALTAWVLADIAREPMPGGTQRGFGELARPAGLEPTTFRSAT
jgi:hypothetical protein